MALKILIALLANIENKCRMSPREIQRYRQRQSCPSSRHEDIWGTGGIAPLIINTRKTLG